MQSPHAMWFCGPGWKEVQKGQRTIPRSLAAEAKMVDASTPVLTTSYGLSCWSEHAPSTRHQTHHRPVGFK
eukprot:11657276-Karenia_brevis.AAC.1